MGQESVASRREFSIVEVFMEDRASAHSSTKTIDSDSSSTRRGIRNCWVLTAYGISGLALFGVLVYYFSTYVTH